MIERRELLSEGMAKRKLLEADHVATQVVTRVSAVESVIRCGVAA